MNKYFKIWKQLANLSISSYLSNRLDSSTFFIGKVIRLILFLLMIEAIFSHTKLMAGYGKYEIILFMLTYYFIDVFGQAVFRGIYTFKNEIKTGNFDFLISKPVNKLFFTASRMIDILDSIFLIPIIYLIVLTVINLQTEINFFNIFFYIMLIISGMLITLGLHIISASITVISEESENFIWLYRETISLGRFPPEILPSFLQLLLTYILPIIIIVSFPVKALLGSLSWQFILFALLYSILFFALSLIIWNKALKHYSSASS